MIESKDNEKLKLVRKLQVQKHRRRQGLFATEGEDLFEAVIDSATLRLRPILMTTGAMVLGAVPLALATGAGAESRTQIGWVIVGGMSFGTLLTLFVVPTAYTLLAGKRQERAAKEHAPAAPAPVAHPGAAD